MNSSESQIQIFGLSMIFYVIVTPGFNSFFQLITQPAKKNENDQPIMALEFVRKAKDVEAIIKYQDEAQTREARDGLKTFLILDTFAFVPLYFAFLLLMSFFLSQTSLQYAGLLASIVVLAATVAAIGDWTENFYSYKALDTVFSSPEDSVPGVFWAAHIKWIAIFVSTGILAVIFWRGGWWNISTFLLIFSSLAGLSGLFFYRPIITLSLIVQLLIILIMGITFLFPSGRLKFLEHGRTISRQISSIIN